jgi:hypothetical protein
MSRLERQIIELLLRDRAFVAGALVRLYGQQEEDEQFRHKTIHRNGIGFNAVDAKVFSPMAEQILRDREISEEQLALCRQPLENGLPRLGRYRRQLARLIKDAQSTASDAENASTSPKNVETVVVG